MRNNFLIAYDLMFPGQHYMAVHEAIKSLGRWYQFQFSLFYVNTPFTADWCDSVIGRALDRNDKLIISDPRGMLIRGVSQADIDAINRVWFEQDRAARAA